MTFAVVGKARIEVDRMWRSPEQRKQFEDESHINYENEPADYEHAFVVWALNKVNNVRT